jgi:glucose-1-phosphate adenylyltransferase
MYPLTKYRSKPAVPLGARYRLIDVPISNCINSGFDKILVLTQYNSESLNKHIFRTYRFDSFSGGFVEVLAASQSYERTDWYQGTADSVRRTLPHLNDPLIDEVIVLSGDQLYMMDLRLLQAFHNEKGADITVSCYPVPVEDASRFGIMEIDDSRRIRTFTEKPKDLSVVKQKPLLINGKKHYLANMGIYFFKKKMLAEVLADESKLDFGREVIPDAIQKRKVYAYTFQGYWSDIGTIASYYEANIMLTGKNPPFNLYNESWPIYTRPRYLPPAKMIGCRIDQAIVAEGCALEEATVERSVVGVRSVIGRGTRIEDAMIVGNDYYESEIRSNGATKPHLGIGSDCEIRRAIVDKNVRIGNRVKITNAQNAREKDGDGYSIRDGVVVVHKGAVIADGTVI